MEVVSVLAAHGVIPGLAALASAGTCHKCRFSGLMYQNLGFKEIPGDLCEHHRCEKLPLEKGVASRQVSLGGLDGQPKSRRAARTHSFILLFPWSLRPITTD